MTFVRGGDRVICFAALAGSPADAATPHDEGDSKGSSCSGHDCDHHDRSTSTALPHDHDGSCCVDVRVPNDSHRPDQVCALPALPPPQLLAIIALPPVCECRLPAPAPPIESRGIPPATGLTVTRILV
jgi:hypothetical protein